MSQKYIYLTELDLSELAKDSYYNVGFSEEFDWLEFGKKVEAVVLERLLVAKILVEDEEVHFSY